MLSMLVLPLPHLAALPNMENIPYPTFVTGMHLTRNFHSFVRHPTSRWTTRQKQIACHTYVFYISFPFV